MTDPRTTQYNERGDVWQHTYAYHGQPLETAERSRDEFDLCERLDYRARVTEAVDRKTAELLREGAARIRALEEILRTTLKSKCSTEGGCA
jgi:hypothetical protein